MNLYEFVMTFSYVLFATGIISLGCHYAEKIKKAERKLEVVMTNLENPLDK